MAEIDFTGTYTVTAGTTVVFNDPPTFVLAPGQGTGIGTPHLIIDGEVDANATQTHSDGSRTVIAGFYSSSGISALRIDASGVFNVVETPAGGLATGYGSGWGEISFSNSGVFSVTSGGDAGGVGVIGGSQDFFENFGQFTVSAPNGSARGFNVVFPGAFHNTGTINVSGKSDVIAANLNGGPASFDNSGTIVAQDSDPATDSIAVRWLPDTSQGFTNSGTLQGDIALIGGGATTNTGHMIGKVELGGTVNFVNSGSVQGAVTFLGGNDIYDGRLGALTGSLDSGDGNDSLAGGAGAETLSGGAGNDTIIGGAGNDLISGGRDSNQLDGGVGADTLSYADATLGVSVDLGAGIAHATGTDTISGFEAAVGGALSDTLIGSAGADTLSGGAGDDRLNGGAGRDVITTGPGADIVVVGLHESSTAQGAADVVTDWTTADHLAFAHGVGSPSNFASGTAADWTSAQAFANTRIGSGAADFVAVQIGADVAVFADSAGDNGSADDAVLLTNANLADVSSASFVAADSGGGGGGSAPTPMQTVTTSSDYHVNSAEWLSFADQDIGFSLSQPSLSAPVPTLRISGEVDVVRTNAISGDVVTVGVGSPSLIVDAGATLKVAASLSGGIAEGSLGGPNLTNGGTITVIADTSARGVNIAGDGQFINTGQLLVTSTHGDAYGVQCRVSHFQNGGVISVTGHTAVTGVTLDTSGQVFVNSAGGSIVAHDDTSSSTSVGVHWSGGFYGGASFENDGRIEGDDALLVDNSSGLPADNLFTNNGTMVGAVILGGGGGVGETLVNNGAITGSLTLGGTGSVYDGHAGTISGAIQITQGACTVTGGAGSESVLGGFSNDSISGGAGNDIIDGGDGTNHLDGGAGVDTLTFASDQSGMGVNADLAAGTAHKAYGSDTFAGFEQVVGSDYNDTLRAVGGSSISAGAGADTVFGAAAGSDYLRGGDGDDSVLGGSGFDDINGNKGNDVIDGGTGGGDWLVGGQGDDLITAHASQNILYGNLGDDTLTAGSGGDLMRGGQGNDSITGGAGKDWISGDRGNDTISGGGGADTFHTFSGAGLDRVLDFHIAEGDRVQVDAGTNYTITQVGSDTVIDMGGGDQMVLVGVQASTLTPGWIFTL